MSEHQKTIPRKRSIRRGAVVLEYVLLLFVIAVACTAAVLYLGSALRGTGKRATDKVTGHEQSAVSSNTSSSSGVQKVEEP
ncbi:TPA: hypothetical protein DDW35_07625 [Candidatus Sumerlaeota bacterium]|nr:hypothetical protein [Candidatus Sumerlaeota bacterium]